MGFIQHSVNWCKGEIMEGWLSLLFGTVLLLVTLSFWKFGNSLFSKAMPLPLLIISILIIGTSLYLVNTNKMRIPAYEEFHAKAPAEFVKSEKLRAEAFIKWYPYTRMIFAGISIVAMLLIAVPSPSSPNLRAVGLTLFVTCMYVFFLDHFSEERALEYYKHIEQWNE